MFQAGFAKSNRGGAAISDSPISDCLAQPTP